MNKEKPYFYIQSTERTLRILEILSEKGEASVSEVSKELGVNRSTAHRLLATMKNAEFLEQNPYTQNYYLSMKLFHIGSTVVNRLNLQQIALPYLVVLSQETGETVNLGVLSEGEIVYIQKIESPSSLRIDFRIGKREPAYCTAMGKVQLAFLPEGQVDKLIKEKGLRPKTAQTICDPAKFKEHLTAIRKDGYAIDNEELCDGLKCVAAPIMNHNGEVVAAISVAGPSMRMNEEKIAEFIGLVREKARLLSCQLGYKP